MSVRCVSVMILCLMCSSCRKQHDDIGNDSCARDCGRQSSAGKCQFAEGYPEIRRVENVGFGASANTGGVQTVQRAQRKLAELKRGLCDAYTNDNPRILAETLSRAARIIDAATKEDRYNLISYFGFAVKHDRNCQVAEIAFCSSTETKASDVVSNYVTYAQAIVQWHFAENSCSSAAANTIVDMMEILEGMRPYCVCDQRNWPALGKVIDGILEACREKYYEKENSIGHAFWREVMNLEKARLENSPTFDDNFYKRKKRCFETFANRMGRRPKWMIR